MSDLRRSLALAAVLALPGCGEQGAPTLTTDTPAATPASPPARVTAADRRRLLRLEARIQAHCVAVSRSLVDPAAAPAPREQALAFAAADDLVAAVRARPRAELDAGQDLRLYLGDVIENLEGSNCDPRMIARLDRGRASIR